MSRQLALSTAISVLAMSAFVLFGPMPSLTLDGSGPSLLAMSAQAVELPSLAGLLPALR